MSRRVEKESSDASGGKPHGHRSKFTEGLLDNGLIVKTLNVAPGRTILDAGCGTGYMSKVFSKAVGPTGKVIALDSDPHFIETLADETRGSNIETIVADITRPTPLGESSLDLIYISTVIHIFSGRQIQDFVREARRLLKPDGLLAVVEIEKKELPFGPPMNRKRSPEELIEIVPLAPVRTVDVAEHFYLQVFQNAGN